MARLVIAARARADIAEILAASLRHFGPTTARSYAGLIAQALEDLRAAPPTLRPQPALFAGCHLYHLKWSLLRARKIRGLRLGNARHFFVCELRPDGTLHLLALLHDRHDQPTIIRELFDVDDEE